MGNSVRTTVLAAVLVLAASLAAAEDRFGVGIKAGTLGLGADFTARVNDRVALRATYSRFDYDDTFDESDIEYDGTLKVGGAGVIVDFYPAKGRFRLSAGVYDNRNAILLVAVPSAPIEIGDTTYEPEQVGSLNGDVAFRSTVPYFGIGWGNAARGPGRASFVFDLGVLQQGSGDVRLASSTGIVSEGDLATEEAQIEDEIDEYTWWPVIALGISFRF